MGETIEGWQAACDRIAEGTRAELQKVTLADLAGTGKKGSDAVAKRMPGSRVPGRLVQPQMEDRRHSTPLLPKPQKATSSGQKRGPTTANSALRSSATNCYNQ